MLADRVHQSARQERHLGDRNGYTRAKNDGKDHSQTLGPPDLTWQRSNTLNLRTAGDGRQQKEPKKKKRGLS